MRTSCLALGLSLLGAINCYAQGEALKTVHPTLGFVPDLSEEAQKEFERSAAIFKKVAEVGFEELSPEEKRIINNVDETKGSIYDVMGGGCSWYCGGGPNWITSSSRLDPTQKITYDAQNAHDFDFSTAWVEGVKGYGIGEYIEYYFEALTPRVTEIQIYNGYVKSDKAWQENSRVKTFKLFVNNKPYAVLQLEDSKAQQIFEVEPLQSTTKGEDLVLRFEIVDVFKGSKYDDTAITEINFDGLDVH